MVAQYPKYKHTHAKFTFVCVKKLHSDDFNCTAWASLTMTMTKLSKGANE